MILELARTRTLDRSSAVVAGAVSVHLVVAVIHGIAHASIPVPILDWQAVTATALLFAAPVTGIGLFLRGRRLTGARILLVAGSSALAFEGLAHFVVRNPDHVATVDAGRALFASTAGLSVAGDLLLVATAVWALRCQPQGSAATTCMDSAT